MKKHLLFLAIALAGASTAQAQSNVIKINTVRLAVQTGSVFWEPQTAIDRSLNLGLLVANYSSTSKSGAYHTEGRGFAFTGEYRLYSAGKGMRG